MNIVCISDTHGLHRKAALPAGDVLIHAGDLTRSGESLQEIVDLNRWLGDQPFGSRICIAGNHDWLFERSPAVARGLLSNAIYLEDSGVTIDGIRFWGSPVQPWFCDWAFNRPRGADIKRHWDMIPADTDVLITHGPPHGILDTLGTEHLGCEELLQAVERIKPKLHVFGHIHAGAGVTTNGDTVFVNAAFLDERYVPANKPVAVNANGRRAPRAS